MTAVSPSTGHRWAVAARSSGALKNRLRRRLGPAIQAVGYASGAMHVSAGLRQLRGAKILMYHSVAAPGDCDFIDPRNHVPAAVFAEQISFLARTYRVVPLSDLIATLRNGESPDPDVVAITFDDGYLDNLTVAAPILERHGVPATLFLATGYIDRAELQWIDELYSAFRFRSRDTLTVEGPNGHEAYELSSGPIVSSIYNRISLRLLVAELEDRRTLLDDLVAQLAPTRTAPKLTLDWEDVRTLNARYPHIALGAHSHDHTDMTGVPQVSAIQEIARCRARIATEVGIQPALFSFPYGRADSVVRKFVAEGGFEAACGGGGDRPDPVIDPPIDLYGLPRVVAPRSLRRLRMLINPANRGLWWRLGR